MSAVATGKTTPIKLFSRTPVPRLAARTNAQKRGCGSSSSRARRNAHIAKAIVSVSVTSGMTIRVKRNRPTHVATHKPAYNPALCPNAQTLERQGHGPVKHGWFLKKYHTIDSRGHPIPGFQHVL